MSKIALFSPETLINPYPAYKQLRDENLALKNQQSNLLVERAQLIERSELARTRVEAMIARLKAMESGS